MTKRERAKVVELLRCGADMNNLVMAGYDTGHCDGVYPCSNIYNLACRAYMGTSRATSAWYHARPRKHLLEAAQRVEEGTWP